MVKFLSNYKYIFLILFVWILFSSPFLFADKTPFPSNYQVNFFSPWSAYPEMKGPVKNNAQPDIIGQIVPWRHFSIEELKSGRLPLWNPYSFAGTPHLANYQSAALFPLNILFFLPIGFINSWSILVLLQPLLAGFFLYLLMRKLSVSSPGSFFSAMSFMFCGFLVTWMGYATLGYAILPLPIALWTILQYADNKKLVWLIFLAFTVMCSFFAGHFQTSLYFVLGIFLFILYQIILTKNKRPYLEALVFVVVGLLLSMPQILPSMELYSLSFRSGLFQKFEAIPLQYITTLFSPDFYGNPVTRNDWFGHYAEWNGYTGVVALSLSIFSGLYYRNKQTLFFIFLAILAFLLAFDTPLLSLLVALKVPVLSTSAASRAIVLFSFSIAVLAGYGFDHLLKDGVKKRKVLIWGSILVGVFISFTLMGFFSIPDREKSIIALKNSILPAIILVLTAGFGLIVMLFKKKIYLKVFILLLLMLSAFEMYRFASKWQNFDPKKYAHVEVGISKFYKDQNHYDRAVGPSGGEDAVYYRMPILSGYDPLYKEEYGEFMQYVGQGKIVSPERSVVTFPYKGKYTSNALNYLGVRFVVHKFSDGNFPWAFPFDLYPATQFTKIYDDGSYHVFRNNDAFERAYLVTDVKVAEHKMIPDFMFENDLRRVAYVEEKIPVLDKISTGEAKISQYLPTKVVIDVKTTGASFLVLTDNYYPGWRVTVNGIRQKIFKTNYSFRGVVIPKGESRVEFTYLPMSFLIGTYLFLLGVLIIIVFGVLKSLNVKK
ncbi:MAG: YfhO family protein [Candidatus Levybacteria bacterium]|nr:YfhO family protein [Candidatus Levybacteria bacterium]